MANYLIIGGSSGIGKAICKLLLEEEHSVLASFRNTAFDFEHENLTTFHWDSESSNWPSNIIPDKLDGLVYSPGLINLKPFHRLKKEDFIQDYNVQVLGAITSIQNCLENLKKSNSASVVLFSTIAVQKGYTFHSLVGSSKGAIEGLSRSLAAEYAPKIRFNSIAPSITNTPLSAKLLNTESKIQKMEEQHPMRRIGSAEDMANITLFLLSEKSSWVTGQVIHVDGGKSKLN